MGSIQLKLLAIVSSSGCFSTLVKLSCLKQGSVSQASAPDVSPAPCMTALSCATTVSTSFIWDSGSSFDNCQQTKSGNALQQMYFQVCMARLHLCALLTDPEYGPDLKQTSCPKFLNACRVTPLTLLHTSCHQVP